MTRISIVLCALALASSIAHADKATATREYQEGQRLFKAGDHAGAAARFKAAWAADPDPVYLFNIAQALRLAKQCAEARDYYKQFLDVVPDAPNRAKVEGYLAEVEACAPPPVIAPPDTRDQPPEVKPPAPVPVPAPAVVQGGGSTRRWIGLGLVGVGLAAAGSGTFFALRVGSLERDREGLCPAPCTWSEALARREAELQQDGDRASTLAIASFAVGGAALVTGAVLYLTGRTTRTEHAMVVPTRGGAVASLGFSF